jgi:hypothetical protein
MITETDWEMGLPPFGVQVEAFIGGHVRTGKRDYGETFRVDDCTFPEQNTTLPLYLVEGWKFTHRTSAITELLYVSATRATIVPLIREILQFRNLYESKIIGDKS